jgi:hypothetical protein
MYNMSTARRVFIYLLAYRHRRHRRHRHHHHHHHHHHHDDDTSRDRKQLIAN